VSKPSGNGSGGLYRVVYSELVQNALKELLERARQKGILTEVLAAVKEIDGRLHNDPTVFGEPHKNLKHKKGQVRVAFVRPLAVEYAVHEKQRVVFITQPLQPLPETGL
jgi:hypothetical protein